MVVNQKMKNFHNLKKKKSSSIISPFRHRHSKPNQIKPKSRLVPTLTSTIGRNRKEAKNIDLLLLRRNLIRCLTYVGVPTISFFDGICSEHSVSTGFGLYGCVVGHRYICLIRQKLWVFMVVFDQTFRA